MPDIIVSRMSDKVIIDTIAALEARFGSHSESYNVAGLSTNKLPQSILASRRPTYAISEANYSTKGRQFTVTFGRNHNASPYFDFIRVVPHSNSNEPPTPEIMLEADQIIRSLVKTPDFPSAMANQELGGILEKEISALSAMHQTLLSDALELRTRYEQEDSERRSRLEAETLAEKERIAQLEHDTLKDIAEKTAELDEKIKEFDLSDHMRARRKQRDEITSQIREFLTHPAGARTSFYRMTMITGICLMGFSLAGFFAYESFQSFLSKSQSQTVSEAVSKIYQQPPLSGTANHGDNAISAKDAISSVLADTTTNDYMLWLLALRGVALSGVAIGFIVYLLTFMRRNHDEELRYQRELQRYGMDINRASWVIETAMEMTTKENATLPDAWVTGACSGLFHSGRVNDAEVNSLSALGAVLGLGPDLEIGPTGAKLSLSGKSAKAAAKDA